MKKSTLIGFNILTIFILFSISYQPIVAEESPMINQIEIRQLPDDECDCNDDIDWDFPIICWILERLWFIIPQFSPFPVPLMHWVIIFINEIFDCPNIP